MNVVVDGLLINYQKSGKGKAILVCLHGWGDSSSSFSELIKQLDDKYTIYALDLPGFGGSQMPATVWGLPDYADFLAEWLDKLDIVPDALIGHSYGGAVAVTAVGAGVPAIRLVLLASAGIRNKQPLRKKVLLVGAKTAKLPLVVLPADKAAKIKQKLYTSIGSDLLVVPQMQQTFRKIINQDIREAARNIHIPVLLIYGNADKQTPVQDGHSLTRSIKGARMEIIGAGHFLHQDEPEKIAKMIDSFIKQ